MRIFKSYKGSPHNFKLIRKIYRRNWAHNIHIIYGKGTTEPLYPEKMKPKAMTLNCLQKDGRQHRKSFYVSPVAKIIENTSGRCHVQLNTQKRVSSFLYLFYSVFLEQNDSLSVIFFNKRTTCPKYLNEIVFKNVTNLLRPEPQTSLLIFLLLLFAT